MTERNRQRAIRLRLARSQTKPAERIATGFSALDAALEGGLPRGCITELAGGPASGKSTLALCMAARVQRDGLAAAWIDVERAFDAAYAERCGIHLPRLPVARPDTAEASLEIARQLASSGAIELLVLDSAAALTPALELQIGIGESGPGLQARVLASGFRRLAFAAARTQTAILVLNQIRGRGGTDSGETSAGGAPMKLYAALRIALEPLEMGSRTRFRILKSRHATLAREGQFSLENLQGASGSP
jgi:recombination protein RecA